MTIFHPLDMPVTGEALAAAANDRLAFAGEWTPWRRRVLELVRDHADAIVDFATRHSWERDAERPPTAEEARDEIATALRFLIPEMGVEHMADGEHDGFTGQIHEALGALAVVAWQMADDLLAGLWRGDATLGHVRPHGLDPKTTREWLQAIAEAEVRAMPRERFHELDEAVDGVFEAGPSGSGEADARWKADVAERAATIARHAAAQDVRNRERIGRIVDATNQNFSLPGDYALRFDGIADAKGVAAQILEALMRLQGYAADGGMENPAAILDWGREPTREKSSFKRISQEEMTRPYGRHVIPLRLDSLGEVTPFAVSEMARAGHHVALILGRDTEIVASGSPLSQPPGWCRAAMIGVVAEIRTRLRGGTDVQLSKAPFQEVGAIIGVDLPLDSKGSRYVSDGETLVETLTLKGRMPATVALSSRGLPLSRIIEHPVLGRDDVFVEWMEVGDEETVIGLRSELLRVLPAPEGHEPNPTVAWLNAVKSFDETAVYGERRYRDRDADPSDPLDVNAPFREKAKA